MTSPAYIVNPSRIEGRGLFAARSLAAGETVVEYLGEHISKAESTRRQNLAAKVFLFEIDENFDVDGDSPGNPARFLNHSCEPNCEATLEDGTIHLHALHAIAAGTELTFDYGYRLAAFPGHPCRCGAPSCVGFIVGRADRWRVRRLLNRPGRSLLAGGRMNARKEVCA